MRTWGGESNNAVVPPSPPILPSSCLLPHLAMFRRILHVWKRDKFSSFSPVLEMSSPLHPLIHKINRGTIYWKFFFGQFPHFIPRIKIFSSWGSRSRFFSGRYKTLFFFLAGMEEIKYNCKPLPPWQRFEFDAGIIHFVQMSRLAFYKYR